MRGWRCRCAALLLGAALGGTAAVGARLSAEPALRPRDTTATAASAASTSTAAGGVLKKAAALVEWGRWKHARDLLADALAQPENQHNAPLIAYYGHLLMKFGQLQAGRDLTRRAVAMDGNCASCHLYRFEAMAEHAKTVSRFRALLAIPKMKKELETAYRLDPKLGDIQWGWVELYMTLPPSLGGGADKAREHANQLVALDAVDGHLALAEIAEDEKNAGEALAQDRAAAEQNPADPRGIFAYGKALYQRGQYHEAATYLGKALALNHNSALYSGYQAANLVHLRELPAALRVVSAGHEVHPDSRLGDYLVAKALQETGIDFQWARQLLQSYLDVPPEPDQPSLEQARNLLAELS